MNMASLLASFLHNSPREPSQDELILAGLAFVFVLIVLGRLRSVSFGLVGGAVAAAVITGFLLWPSQLREPKLGNPAPPFVFLGAIVGAVAGTIAAAIGKSISSSRPAESTQKNKSKNPNKKKKKSKKKK